VKKELTKGTKTAAPPPEGPAPDGEEVRESGKPSGIRYASDEQFGKAQRKTSALHAGLFRRLAK
jgi:hypothetical protein